MAFSIGAPLEVSIGFFFSRYSMIITFHTKKTAAETPNIVHSKDISPLNSSSEIKTLLLIEARQIINIM